MADQVDTSADRAGISGVSAGFDAEDPAEVAKFEAMAADWWDPDGPHAPLHAMNPCRLGWALDQIAAHRGLGRGGRRWLSGLSALDIGCGGGLMSEPLARLGARVTGIDAAPASAPIARLHGAAQGLQIDYRTGVAEALLAEEARFDIIVAMEVIEHVPDQAAFVATAAGLLAPDGILLMSTLNRTAAAWALAIAGAEYVMGWLPRGTHDWRRFIAPEELEAHTTSAGLKVVDARGMVFDPLSRQWSTAPGRMEVNYLMAAVAP
ncbi:MAG: bifunctional 2-polyprenyl-6-hydroxyphenol methylase/3-demethylubiquinol 3-O-methyltransferase UbiG [Pseudomonadota bacterium]